MNDPKMTLTCSRSKVPTFTSHTPLWPKFLSASLSNEPFLVTAGLPTLEKSAPNDPKMRLTCLRSEVSTFIPKGPNFPVSLYGEKFLSYGPILRKVH